MTPHVFFIPTFKFHSEYGATCGSCASMLGLSDAAGRRLARNPGAGVLRGRFLC
jgi:hypothetical protein